MGVLRGATINPDKRGRVFKMPVVGTDLVYELIVKGSVGGTPTVNVFGYYNVGFSPSLPGAGVLNGLFDSQVMAAWSALTSTAVTLTEVSSRRLNNLTDFNTFPISQVGLVIGDRGTDFSAFKIGLIRSTKETRSGHKRIAGLVEIQTTASGNLIDAATLTLLTTLAGDFASQLLAGGDDFRPCIIGGKYDTVPDPPVLKPEADWVYNPLSAVTASSRVTSQVSRKG